MSELEQLGWQFLATEAGRAYMDEKFGRTPQEAMEKLRQRNPDYDHKPYPPSLPNPARFNRSTEWHCACGAQIWLTEIDSDGLRFSHQSGCEL